MAIIAMVVVVLMADGEDNMGIKNRDFIQGLGGLLNGFLNTTISERDKNREQERILRDEARQNAVLSLQRLQNKQRVNEFNKSFEEQQRQYNVSTARENDKVKFDKMLGYKEYIKQFQPVETMPESKDGFQFKQRIPGNIDDEFAQATGVDLLKNDQEYYDVNAYQNARNDWMQQKALNLSAENNRLQRNEVKARDMQIYELLNKQRLTNQLFDKLSAFSSRSADELQNKMQFGDFTIAPYKFSPTPQDYASNRKLAQGTWEKLNYLKNFLQGNLQDYQGQLSGYEMMQNPSFRNLVGQSVAPLNYLLQNSKASGLGNFKIGALKHLSEMIRDYVPVAQPDEQKKD